MKLAQQVAEAAAVARTSTSAEQDKNAEIAQHIKYAKERITASISDMSKTNLLRGKAELSFWHSYSKQHTSDSWCDSSMIHTVGEAFDDFYVRIVDALKRFGARFGLVLVGLQRSNVAAHVKHDEHKASNGEPMPEPFDER